jgi:hypothetical protein
MENRKQVRSYRRFEHLEGDRGTRFYNDGSQPMRSAIAETGVQLRLMSLETLQE